MKRTLRVFKTKEAAAAADASYWLSRPISERLAAVEALRVFMHGTATRLERVLVVAERGKGVAVLGRADLEANKLAAGRPKDLLDVELLRESRPRGKKRG